jgi:hypothetical protein
MGKRIPEIIASIWLIIVAVQYVSRYFFRVDVDFSWTYFVMLGLCLISWAFWVLRAIKCRGAQQE